MCQIILNVANVLYCMGSIFSHEVFHMGKASPIVGEIFLIRWGKLNTVHHVPILFETLEPMNRVVDSPSVKPKKHWW